MGLFIMFIMLILHNHIKTRPQNSVENYRDTSDPIVILTQYTLIAIAETNEPSRRAKMSRKDGWERQKFEQWFW